MENIAQLTIITLIPLVPTFFAFRLLSNSKAELSGPFSGFALKLGGPFAAYIITLFAVQYAFSLWQASSNSFVAREKYLLKPWEVKANIILIDKDSNRIRGNELKGSLNSLRTSLSPALPQRAPASDRVTYKLPNGIIEEEQLLSYALQFEVEGDSNYQPGISPLSGDSIKRDSIKKIIDLGKIYIVRKN